MLKVKPCREAKPNVQTLAPSPIHRIAVSGRSWSVTLCVSERLAYTVRWELWDLRRKTVLSSMTWAGYLCSDI